MVVTKLSVETKETNETEVAEVLVEGVASKVSSHCVWVLTSIVRLQLRVRARERERERERDRKRRVTKVEGKRDRDCLKANRP